MLKSVRFPIGRIFYLINIYRTNRVVCIKISRKATVNSVPIGQVIDLSDIYRTSRAGCVFKFQVSFRVHCSLRRGEGEVYCKRSSNPPFPPSFFVLYCFCKYFYRLLIKIVFFYFLLFYYRLMTTAGGDVT